MMETTTMLRSPRTSSFGTSFRTVPKLACLLAVVAMATPVRANSQVLPAVIGGVGGLLAGVHTTTGIFVLKSRATGWVMHSVEHLLEPSPEAIPILVGPIAGAAIGYSSKSALAQAGLWGSAGLASGALAGAAVGHLIWKDSEGRWAGGVIGSAAGLLLGVVLGASRGAKTEELDPSTVNSARVGFSFRSPWGTGR